MAKKFYAQVKNGKVTVTGEVTEVKEVADDKTAVIFEDEYEDKNGETITRKYVFQVEGKSSDRIRKAGVKAGKIIMIWGERIKGSAVKFQNFCYTGIHTEPGNPDASDKKDKYESSTILAYITFASNTTKEGGPLAGGKLANFSGMIDPTSQEMREQKQKDFLNIQAWSDDKQEWKKDFAEKAYNDLAPVVKDGKKTTILAYITTGKAGEYKGRPQYSIWSYAVLDSSTYELKQNESEAVEETSDNAFVDIEGVGMDIPFFNGDEDATETKEDIPWLA